MPNRFQSASEGPLLKSSNGDDFEVLQVDVKPHDRLPIIDQLERALITALVNVASQALKNEVSDVFNILSGCLLRLLSAWTSAFVDDFSMSEAGRYLIGLLALEPNLLGRTAPNTSLGFLSLLRRNLKILEAVLLLPSSEEYPIGKTSMTQSTAAILDAMPNPQLTVDHSLPVSPTSISTLYDWIDSVTSLQLNSPSPGLDPKYTINSDRPMATLIENRPICDAAGGGHQETTEFLDQLRLFYDQGQHQWLATVSQINYILTERDHFLHTLAGACQQALKLSGHAADASSSVSWWCPAPPPELGPISPRTRRQPPPISLHTICDSLVAPFPTPVGNAMRNRLIQAQITWLRGEMCNFDYLMVLNTVAGRTYNDLTQYPIFPWIISDFNSEVLDLSKPSSFRNLHRPVSVQTEARAEKHLTKISVKVCIIVVQIPISPSKPPTAIGVVFANNYSHYAELSNFAVIINGNFDAPDRSFHSVATEWQLATSSVACTKELVPEFFIRPDLFANWENFELGSRQNGSPIDCVVLPPWAKGDPRLFTLVNRAAFESTYVTAHLPAWIDLVFGYKQTGRNAERALNLYNPFTYFGAIDVDAIEDPVRRCAVQSMIRNYGQVPRQLFPNHPHPRRTIDPLRDNLTKEVAVSGKAAEFLGFIWLIRLFLSSLLAPAASPLPTEEGMVNCGNWDSSVAVVNPPSEMDDSEERQQGLTRGLNVSVVPQTAGAPLDTVIGLAWGKWAGSPATDPVTFARLHYAPIDSDAGGIDFPCASRCLAHEPPRRVIDGKAKKTVYSYRASFQHDWGPLAQASQWLSHAFGTTAAPCCHWQQL
ncbi:unnamed protein product [Dibothriocephalus latus]|uniref:BEACH domain-containing protein n=1 Tax=Dibothriocephalus latus TaxID=60516 RepID=A0A3P6TJL3_DIBLA|nr:unnamed protein product [Dibothriocephalus latus]